MDPSLVQKLASLEAQTADLQAEIGRLGTLLAAINMTVFNLNNRAKADEDEARHRPEEDTLPPDLPGFSLRRKGPGEYNKLVMSAGYAIGKPSATSATSVAERTFTLTAARVFFAKFNHATAAWVLSSGNIVHDDTSLPTPTAADTIVPIASVTWDTGNSCVGDITQYHVGVLTPPAFLPNGSADYDVLSWDNTAKVWGPDVVRGHA